MNVIELRIRKLRGFSKARENLTQILNLHNGVKIIRFYI